MEKDNIINIDSEEYNTYISSPGMTTAYQELLLHKNYDRIRIKTPLLTKEYDKDHNLISVEPFFVDVRLTPPPFDSSLMEEYPLRTGAIVSIIKSSQDITPTYHINMPEMQLSFKDLIALKEEYYGFMKTGNTNNIYIKRWYLEFGILEHLFFDDNVLEININPPAYKTPIRIVHSKHQECKSNIYPSDELLNYLSTRLKISTGRPLNRAQTQLDGEISIENQRARVAAIIEPFSVFGTGFSIRKHREQPWTLPLFMSNNTVNEWFAGLMSFMITHGRTFLTAGPRGSGKTSLLGSLILEILPKYRIITIEDTQELPIKYYRSMGYDILPLKVRSALLQEGLEMPFDTGLRTSLRLGDSALIIGEVRSKEASVLYEAMRIGAMSNTVGGTIHADNPYGVYDRVVNDLGVPKGSFKATDIIIIQKLIKSPTGLGRERRVVSVTEVLKHWDNEPVFQDLLLYNPNKDALEPTKFLLEGKSETINNIMANTKGYETYNDTLNDIYFRGMAKKSLISLANGKNDFLEAWYVGRANTLYANLFETYNPLKSRKNRDNFFREYNKELSEILNQGRK
ncbi:MAG: ATPase, T2SS/T4P/T4SS family [Candidatus Woesearchaeota archaeon]